ncbi:MAG: hypothetical protein M1407_05470 [Deltaproteobacteria bacterium]|nr:hypothetical protein [Deltaproteobacteria bacterium]
MINKYKLVFSIILSINFCCFIFIKNAQGLSFNNINKKLNYYKPENVHAVHSVNNESTYENPGLGDEIIASVDNNPITLNDIYFLGNFRRILYGEKGLFNNKFSDKKINKLLNIYINRFLILKEEHKIDIIKIPVNYLNSYIKNFMQDYRKKYKNLKFSQFLIIFGYNYTKFENFIRNILIEKEFIAEHLKLFFNMSKKNIIILKKLEHKKNFENSINKSKKVSSKQLSSKNIILDLKTWINKLRSKAAIDIVSTKY